MAVSNLQAFISEARGIKFSSISSLGEHDVISIWKSTSQFIRKQMIQLKGVTVPGFGTFTFSQIKLSIGNKFIIIQRPVFVFSEWFLQTHHLTCTRPCASGHIPVIPLNYSVLSNEGPYSRDLLQLCIKEILLAMSRCLFARRNVHLDFYEVGRVIIKDSKVQMKFFRSFINQLDCSGELENSFRPGTAQSVVSIMTNPRSSTSSEYILPRLHNNVVSSTHSCHATGDLNGDGNSSLEKDSIKNSSSQDKCPHQLLPKTVLLVSSEDKQIPRVPSSSSHSSNFNDCLSCSHNSSTNQELCYFCHQRKKRNVHVNISDEKKTREIKYDKMLQEYQDIKHHLASTRESEARKVSRMFAKDTSLHNLSVVSKKKAQRDAKCNTFHPSYIFQCRVTSPDTKLQQDLYCSELDRQVKKDHQTLKEINDRKQKMEKKEHKELTTRLQNLEEAYTKEKAERTAAYKKALAEQICNRQIENDASAQKYPVFGVHDESVQHRPTNRKDIFMAHLQGVREKHQKKQEEAIQAKQEDAEIMKKAKQQLLLDIQASSREKFLERKELEETWNSSLHQHQSRVAGESIDTSILLHEQCEKYKRCHRCQRTRENKGQSSFLHDMNLSSGL